MKYLIKLTEDVEFSYIKDGEVIKGITKEAEDYEFETNLVDEQKVYTAVRSIIETYSVIKGKGISDLCIKDKIDILEKSLHRIFGDNKIKINKVKDVYVDTGLVI